MSTRLRITHADLTPDLPWEGEPVGEPDNEVKLTLSDGTEIFLSLKGADLKWPELTLSTGLGRAVMGVDINLFRRETQ